METLAEHTMKWWREMPREQKKSKRLSWSGAVAEQLCLHDGDVSAVQAWFRAQEERLKSRYPKFWMEAPLFIGRLSREEAR